MAIVSSALGSAVAAPLLKHGMELLLPVVRDVVAGAFGESAANRIVSEVKLRSLDIDGSLIAARAEAIQRDQGGTWLQRNWRPISMLVFVYMAFHIVVVGPVLDAWLFDAPGDARTLVPHDPALLGRIIDLIRWGLTGYVTGRSAEKITRTVMATRAERREVEAPYVDAADAPPIPPDYTERDAPFLRPTRTPD